jgi:hypothetical protein
VTLDLTGLASQINLASQISLTPLQAVGIPIALTGSIFLALGAQFQHRGVTNVEAKTDREGSSGLSIGQLLNLVRSPAWVVGTLMLGLAVVFQLTSLGFAPIIVVQPLGAVALVITSIVNSRVSHVALTRDSFVTIATFTAKSKEITESQLITVLILLAAITVVFSLIFAFLRKRFKAIIYIVGAGVLYGFVATLAKVVIDRIHTIIITGSHEFEWLTIVCIVALLAATALGGYFVQTAYASGPPDLVIAGLTVIDPIVAVTIGVVVLREADGAPWFAIVAFVVAGALAVYGVFQLAKYHPQAQH